MIRIALVTVLLLLAFGATADAQVKNPTMVEFGISADHALIDGYVLDLIDAGGAVIQTLDVGKPDDLDGDGLVQVSINVMPITFGIYTGEARATAAGAESDNSPASVPWERAPGPPSRPDFR